MADKIDINEKKAKIEWIYNSGDNYNYNRITKRDTKKYRLPFALCKSRGITIQDWWRPRDAWNALKRKGVVDNVSEEYKEFYRQKESANSKESRKWTKTEIIKLEKQLKGPNHNPDRNYKHKDGYIAGAIKGKPMNFKQADSGNVNPYYYSKHLGYDTNCQTCVATYFARRQGYDVRALPNLYNKYIIKLSRNTTLAYIDKKGNHPILIPKPLKQKVDKFLNQHINDGEIWAVNYQSTNRQFGHIIIAERGINGRVRLYDPQNNKIISSEHICSYFEDTQDIKAMKLTGYKIDEKFADKIMKRSKKNG